MSQVHI